MRLLFLFLCSNNVSSPKHVNFLESRKLQFIQNKFSMYFWYYRPSRNKFFHICLTFFIIIFKPTKIAKKATMEWDRYLIHLIWILRRLEEVCWSHLAHIKIEKIVVSPFPIYLGRSELWVCVNNNWLSLFPQIKFRLEKELFLKTC